MWDLCTSDLYLMLTALFSFAVLLVTYENPASLTAYPQTTQFLLATTADDKHSGQAVLARKRHVALVKRADEIRKTLDEQDAGERKRLAEWRDFCEYYASRDDPNSKKKYSKEETVRLEELGPTFITPFPENVGHEDLSIGAVATTRLLRRIDPLVLAQIQPGQQIVFSTKAIRKQRAFSSSVLDIVEELVTEYNASSHPSETSSFTSKGVTHTYTDTPPSHIGPISKAMLIIDGDEAFFGCELKLFDKQGKMVFSKVRPRPLFETTFFKDASLRIHQDRDCSLSE